MRVPLSSLILEPREVQQGVYLFSDQPTQTGEATVLVHPFYLFHRGVIPFTHFSYLAALHSHLEETRNPVIVVEEQKHVVETFSLLHRRYPSLSPYFILTRERDIAPVGISFDEMIKFLNSFDGERVDFAGGHYHPLKSSPGCLGKLVEEFGKISNKRARVLTGLVF